MQETIFTERWFSHHALNGLRAALHGMDPELKASEAALVPQLVLHLLDRERRDPGFGYSDILGFYGFCQRNLRRTASQIYQDLWVLFMLGEKRDGYFVEFGACDGRMMSNTLLLEKAYGWTGILAEPNPRWHAGLAGNRGCAVSHLCVAAESGQEVTFLDVPAMPELSRLAATTPDDVHEKNGNRAQTLPITVRTVSLGDLLDSHGAPGIIDYLSVDTEGSELEILRAFDFDRYRIRLLTVEHAGEADKRAGLLALLESKGFTRWHTSLSRWDDWYVGPAFRAPG